MRTPTETFDWACRNKWKNDRGQIYGTRYETTRPDEKPIFDLLSRRAEDAIRGAQKLFPRLSPIYFAYIDNGTPNAIADIVDGVPCIGMFRGAVLLLNDLFQRMLSHPNILAGLGNASDEIEHVQHRDGVVPDIDELRDNRQMNGEAIETIRPVDPARMKFAVGALVTAFDFLLGHEFGHVGKGHVDYLRAERGLPFVLEANSTPIGLPDDIALDFQTLELDADSMGASSFSLHSVFTPEFKHPDISTPQQKLYFWALAVGSVFYLFDLHVDLNGLEVASHPPAILRLTFLHYWAQQVVQVQCPSILPETAGILSLAFESLVKVRSVLGSPFSIDAFDDVLDNPYAQARLKRHVDAIQNRIPMVVPKVAKYDYLSRSV